MGLGYRWVFPGKICESYLLFFGGIRCIVMGKKRENISTVTDSCSEITPLLHINGCLKKKNTHALLFMVHVIKHQTQWDALACLLSFFFFKRQLYFVWKMFTLQMVLLLRVQTGWLPAGTDLTHPNTYLLQTVGGGMFGGREMLMELDSEPHQGAEILSTPCTLTNLFLLCCLCKRKQFF